MDEKLVERTIKRWVIENYVHMKRVICICINYAQETNYMNLTLEIWRQRRSPGKKLIVKYSGDFDETFLAMAKFKFDQEIAHNLDDEAFYHLREYYSPILN